MNIKELIKLTNPKECHEGIEGEGYVLYFSDPAETKIILSFQSRYIIEEGTWRWVYLPKEEVECLQFTNKYRMSRYWNEKFSVESIKDILNSFQKIKGWNDMLPWKLERVVKRGKPMVRSIKCISGRLLLYWNKGEARTLKEMHDADVVIRTGVYRRKYGKDSVSKVLEQLILHRYIERISLGLYQRTAKRLI